jgi:acyl-CoA dehydrogenase
MSHLIDLDEISFISDNLKKFIDTEIIPLERDNRDLLFDERNTYESSGRYVPQVLELRKAIRRKSFEAGFYTMLAPEHLGGGGLGATAGVLLQQMLWREYGPSRILIHTVVLPSPFTNGLTPILAFLKDDLKARCLPDFASGEKTLCFALSEPDAGSDVFSIRTRAELDGGDWIINGTKQWITNSPYADYAMVFAVTDRDAFSARKGGITGFLVETKTPGFNVTGIIKLMGHLGGETGVIALDNVRVSDSHRIGEQGKGLNLAMHGVNAGRLSMAGGCVGLAEWALQKAIDYAKTRKTFGKLIGEHQAIQIHLAECAMDIYATKSMVLDCARRVDTDETPRKEISIIKAFATEMVGRVLDRCMQIHGGMGLSNELGLEEGYRHARLLRIPDGTGEIQRRTIARALLGGDTTF